MARLQCRTCGGIYGDVGPDGVRYFHVCPSLSLAELEAAVAARTVQLAPGETVDAAHASRVFPRPDARDENIDRTKVLAARLRDGTLKVGRTDADLMKTQGAGVDRLPDAPRANGRL